MIRPCRPPTCSINLPTYLLELRNQGMPRREIEPRTQSLKRFYAWAAAEKLMRISPFEEFDLERPILTPAQIRHRHETLPEDPTQRELVRLRSAGRRARHFVDAICT